MIFIFISSLILTAASVESALIDKAIKFRVYVHLVRSGPDANLYEVARANITASSPTSFGLVTVGDTLVTSGPDMNTGKLGRVQGYIINAGRSKLAQLVTVNYLFTEGKYRGSTLIVAGRNNEEASILGGTGKFRMARGYITTSTYSSDPTTGRIVIQDDINVYFH